MAIFKDKAKTVIIGKAAWSAIKAFKHVYKLNLKLRTHVYVVFNPLFSSLCSMIGERWKE